MSGDCGLVLSAGPGRLGARLASPRLRPPAGEKCPGLGPRPRVHARAGVCACPQGRPRCRNGRRWARPVQRSWLSGLHSLCIGLSSRGDEVLCETSKGEIPAGLAFLTVNGEDHPDHSRPWPGALSSLRAGWCCPGISLPYSSLGHLLWVSRMTGGVGCVSLHSLQL